MKTVRELLKGTTWHGYKVVDIIRALRRDKAGILDWPVVEIGDKNVVLAVDREELEEAARVTVYPLSTLYERTVAAILARLDFREVERIVPRATGMDYLDDEDHARAVFWPGDSRELAILKPESQSKEDSNDGA